MLTTDPIYKKALLPVITISNTANSSTLYTYSAFTGLATGVPNVYPIYCSVNLSQFTHGEFVIQFEDTSKVMESTVTVNSRVFINCGKQSGTTTRLISGLVRKKGYSRGSNGKVLYTISGTSTGIRLNEIITYAVSQAARTADGITPDVTDATRKADQLLFTNIQPKLSADGILNTTSLVANSDVESFIASLSIEYGTLQDVANFIEQQSGSHVVVDGTDVVNLRYEIKNTLAGRGFTIKNSNANQGNDDADDTMYLRGKNWTSEDDFYTSGNYANKVTAILPAEPRPNAPIDLGFVSTNSFTVSSTTEYAVKFKPPHTRFTPGDVYVVGSQWSNGVANVLPIPIFIKICKDAAGVPQNVGGIVGIVYLFPTNFQDPLPTAYTTETTTLVNDEYIYNSVLGTAADIYLDTTKDYWIIFSNNGMSANIRFSVGRNENITLAPVMMHHTANFSTITAGGSGYIATPTPRLPCFGVGRYRSSPHTIWDPKAVQNVQSGITGGQYIESLVTESAVEIKNRDALAKYMIGQLYTKSRPQTIYNFPRVMAPNIPPFPGDPIVISDTILGLSTAGNQVILTTCGDMTYQWGAMGSGNYEAPTMLNINAIGVPPRYR